MPQQVDDPLSMLIKRHPVGYFIVMFLLALAVGTILFDFAEYIDKSIVPTIKGPRYVAAVVFAFGAHIGLSWRRKKLAKRF